jgi:predicted Rossmann-fold nucleotide-binding protein
VLLLNTNGFYDTLLKFLDECVEQGMLTAEKREIVLVARTVDEALALLGLTDLAKGEQR